MHTLLSRIGTPESPFRPRSVTEFFALQLARKLGDEANLEQYLRVGENHSRDLVLRAFARARKRSSGTFLARRFAEEMERLTSPS